MPTLKNKDEVLNELKSANIEICCTRKVGYNSFRLVYESYGLFLVNATKDVTPEATKEFQTKFNNIIITIDN